MNSAKELSAARFTLSFLSLIATFLFLIGIGSGFGALLFAVSGTVIQLTVTLYMPNMLITAWWQENLIVTGVTGVIIATVVLVSVAGSTSILSGLVEDQKILTGQKETVTHSLH